MKNKTLTIIMTALAGMTALPMQAIPVFAESTEIRNTTEDGSSFVGDWSCGASGSKTMTINADGTYTAKNGDKEESGKWKMQNGDLMLDNGATDATRCTLDGDMINAYVDGSVSVYEVSTPMRCIAPIEVVSKAERSSEKYLQELPIKGFVLEAVPLSSLEHKTDEPYAGRANKGLFTKPPIHWQMMPKEYFSLRFAFKARA